MPVLGIVDLLWVGTKDLDTRLLQAQRNVLRELAWAVQGFG